MIPGLIIKSKYTRTVAKITLLDGDQYLVEPMHFLTLPEAKRDAQCLARSRRQVS